MNNFKERRHRGGKYNKNHSEQPDEIVTLKNKLKKIDDTITELDVERLVEKTILFGKPNLQIHQVRKHVQIM